MKSEFELDVKIGQAKMRRKMHFCEKRNQSHFSQKCNFGLVFGLISKFIFDKNEMKNELKNGRKMGTVS